jgi:putative transposase
MRVASQAKEGATEMKSRMKPALRVVPAATVQLTMPVQGVLKDVKSAFYGLCIQAGKEVLAAMMEADRIALCGPKGVPDARRRAVLRPALISGF